MSEPSFQESPTQDPPLPVEAYYRWQSLFYDATRWSFLFGRSAILSEAVRHTRPSRILEIGCGTGRNLVELAKRFPDAQLAGLDVSADMLAIAEKKLTADAARLRLVRRCYDQPIEPEGFDLVLCSYALSMFNPGWEEAIESAWGDLAPGGYFAFVDFHDSHFTWFRRWMGVNHVRMDGHLLPTLEKRFEGVTAKKLPAYGGVWEYSVFLGRKA